MQRWRWAIGWGGLAVATAVATLVWAQEAAMPPTPIVLPTPDSPLSIVAWIERVGLPIVLVVVLFYSGVRVSRWLGTEIVKPLADQGVEFIKAVAKTNSAMAEHQAQQNQMLREMTAHTKATADAIVRLERVMEGRPPAK